MQNSFSNRQAWLPYFLGGLMIFSYLILISRTFELQIIKGKYYKSLAEGNRIRRVKIDAPRGRILARGGEVLVDNVPVHKKIVFSPEGGYEKEITSSLEESQDIITEYKRYYPLAEKLAHLGGYVGPVTEDEAGKVDPKCTDKGEYKLDSTIGRGGLEEYYNCSLSGIDGEELIEVDTGGKKVRVLGRKEPIAGQDLHTTIDYNLQLKTAEYVNGKAGAVVITDTLGEVLALYSSPSFDPNIFYSPDRSKVEEVLNDPSKPLFNRAVAGLYHPGSAFKILVSLASLEEGVISENYRYSDNGFIEVKSQYGNFVYNNWYYTQYGGVEGEIDLTKAIARSTDTFFYKTGELLGIEKLVSWSERFGLNDLTNIDIPGEMRGLVPSPKWKEIEKGEKWYLGNTYHMSIGQGDLAITPLAVNRLSQVVANGGLLCPYRLVQKEVDCIGLGLDEKNINLVKTGMGKACSQGGTGYTFFDADPPVACKTGTAETYEEDVTHAWFTFIGPYENPEIVVTVLIEKGGEGSSSAGPVARDIYDYWLNLK